MKNTQTEIMNVANFINGYPFKPTDWALSGFRIIRIQNLTDPKKSYNYTTKKVPEKYIVRKGDILVSWSATIDVFEWEEDDSYLNQHIFKVEFDENKVTKSYFKIALKKTINDLIKFAHGSTMKHVVKGDFDNHKIPLPPLEDQIRIAAVLTRAEKLIAKRKESIKALDEFLKSTFLEMFGDPVRNEKGWNKKKMVDFCGFENGDRSSNYPSGEELVSEGIHFINSKAIVDFRFSPINPSFITREKYNSLSNGKCKKGDLLFTLRGNGLGKCCVFDGAYFEGFVNAQLIIIRPNSECVNYFLIEQFRHPSMFNQIWKYGSGSAQPQLSGAQLGLLKIILPPFSLQTQFASIVEKVEAIKAKYTQSLSELEKLYGSLNQRAFKGELDLSRVPLEK